MSILGKLLGVVTVHRTLSATALFQQMLRGLAIFIILSGVLGVFAGILLLNGIYVAYNALLLNGLQPFASQAIIGIIALIIIGLLCIILHKKIQRLENIILRLLRIRSPIASRLNDITVSFMDGLLEPTTSEKL